jgi:hypothetical protein
MNPVTSETGSANPQTTQGQNTLTEDDMKQMLMEQHILMEAFKTLNKHVGEVGKNWEED